MRGTLVRMRVGPQNARCCAPGEGWVAVRQSLAEARASPGKCRSSGDVARGFC
jgi:hypothetical protein